MNNRAAPPLLALVLVASLNGCGHPAGQQTAPGQPVIPVSQPVQRQVTDYVDYTGRIDAIDSVTIRARVTGFLVKAPFKEGAEVKKGDLLFQIDPRPYQALVNQAKAQVALAQAQLKLAKSNYQRDLSLAPGNVSPQQLDYDRASVDQAEASVKAAQATLEAYQLNLEFTEVTSPIDGMVSRFFYTVGNLVTQDQTALTTVVSLDPVYVYFDVDERTLLRVRVDINRGKIQAAKDLSVIPVYMGVSGEQGFPHEGRLNFVNNAVNPSTGTIAVRGVFPNPLPPNGRRLLSPGMFARVRLPIGGPHPALLVIDRAIGSDQGQRFVYVVDAENKVQYRRVTIGPLQDDGLRVIQEGVKRDDWVVVSGLLQIRPRMEIEPDRIAMPTFSGEADDEEAGPILNKPQPPPPGENKQPGQGQGTKP
jgi:multidrug efflux system membrane fusion protein